MCTWISGRHILSPRDPNRDANEIARHFNATGEAEPVFEEPWQAQIFAIVVELHKRGAFSWKEWSEALGAEKQKAAKAGVGTSGGDDYRLWLTALEKLLDRKGITQKSERTDREDAWRQAARSTPHGEPIELTPQSTK